MPRPTLYLASESPRRRQLLRDAGIAFEPYVVPVDEEELSATYAGPLELLGEYLAREKALAAWRLLRAGGRSGLVLASDTTVLLDGKSLAKPADAGQAWHMLRLLRGREHTVATGVALAGPDDGQMTSATSATRVRMRDYHDDEIAAYVASGDPFDKAGAYSIQHPDFFPVASLQGCHLGVIGLPTCLVLALLRGTPLPSAPSTHRGGCPWSPMCTPPYPDPHSIHDMPDREGGTR